jgi:hypothetical protein
MPVDPLPTLACIIESLLIVKDDASVFPNFTDDTPVNWLPLIVTRVPGIPYVGLNEFNTGFCPCNNPILIELIII